LNVVVFLGFVCCALKPKLLIIVSDSFPFTAAAAAAAAAAADFLSLLSFDFILSFFPLFSSFPGLCFGPHLVFFSPSFFFPFTTTAALPLYHIFLFSNPCSSYAITFSAHQCFPFSSRMLILHFLFF
jgi:hypothetical protein